jgi:hypothetical protein
VGRFRNKRALMADALGYLASLNVIRSAPEEKVGPGRNPSPRWDVNPALYDLAQFARFAPNSAAPPAVDPYDAEERAAIQEETS